MRDVPLWFPFSIATFVAIFGTALAPGLHLCAFAPIFALLSHRKSHVFSLYLAASCGFLMDLLSSEHRLGLYAMTYCLTMAGAYSQKHHFFEDKPLALSLFTALISSLATLIQFGLMTFFSKSLPFTWTWFFIDFIVMPWVDALYAYLLLYYPMQGYLYFKKNPIRLKTINGLKFRHLLGLFWSFFGGQVRKVDANPEKRTQQATKLQSGNRLLTPLQSTKRVDKNSSKSESSES